ncbi:REP-associated tyrosine transposase [Pseudomonas putida]|uniref:REP-associated tyrosine transposase n=1 Tax=Pseudomonas TaxID=286 RepID=UPI0009BDE983|nr:transposase [Pseudomonas putida]
MSYPASKRLRIGRYSEPGRFYFLTCSVENREPLFQDLWLARAVVRQFRLAQEEGAGTSLAWVVMPDHIHWLVELHETPLDVLMRRFKSRSAYAINRLRQTRGRIWQAGFYDFALRREDNTRDVARYIIANPIRAGLVEKVRDYPHWDAVWVAGG